MVWAFTSISWVAIVVPFVLAATVALLAKWLGRTVAVVSMAAPLTVLAVGIAGMVRWHEVGEAGAFIAGTTYRWMLTPAMPVPIGWAVDGLTALMLTVVGFVSLMVMIFSIGYMANDTGYARYFALLSLFTGSMSALVLADGLPGLFVGWELVGACSYLLIGFWFEKPSASAAAVKAFLTTRVGDIGLLLGVMWLWQATGLLTYRELFPGGLETLSAPAITGIALLLFVGAAGKSAQFPLHIWLPDAMEGPTPVSALIHAATMVAAGVFLLARTWPIFEAAPAARAVVLAIGAFTALASATIALAQTDIKKVLAYSTISQLGFMFAALGAGAWVPAIFHLVTHAAFKALLFLGSGSVIHGSGTQDMREMGGLLKVMPWTAATWIIGSAALAGVPPLAGFFSKDEVLHAVFAHSPVAGGALFVASLFTAFYITRATRLTFFGPHRGHTSPHESGPSMLAPLVSLSVLALGLGFAGHEIAYLLGGHAEKLDPVTAVVSTLVAAVGIFAGWRTYKDGAAAEVVMEGRFRRLWPLLRSGYAFDAFVYAIVVRPVQSGSEWLYAHVDKGGIDRLVEGVGSGVSWLGERVRRMQFGDVQWYTSLVATGFIVLLVLSIMWPQFSGWFGGGR